MATLVPYFITMKKHTLFLLLFSISFGYLAQDSLNMRVLYNWKDNSLSATNLYNNAYNEVWGYAKNGREYAIIGTTRGTHFFDVTNPQSPTLVDFVQGRDTGRQSVHRDYHDYQGYLYIVTDEGKGSLQIVDLSYLPDSVSLVYDQDTAIKLSHNIFIDSARGKLYSCGGGSSRKFSVYSLSNPLSPQLIYRCETDISWWAANVGTSGGYVHDVFVRNDTAYCNAGSGLFVVDFSTTPVLLGSISSYPDKGYNHSGWLSEDGNTYALGDETHGKKLKMLDVSDLSNITFLDTVGITDNSAILHNQIIKGDLMYVAYYYNGVYVYNIKNPSSPILTGFYDTSKELNFLSFKGCWGIYPFLPSGVLLASDMQEGLFILDVSQATSIDEIANKNRFSLFPNPASNQFYLMGLSNYNEGYNVEVRDINGKKIVSNKFENNFLEKVQIQIPNEIPAGVYVVTIFNSTFAQSIKLIKH